jgi:hypothetical protein
MVRRRLKMEDAQDFLFLHVIDIRIRARMHRGGVKSRKDGRRAAAAQLSAKVLWDKPPESGKIRRHERRGEQVVYARHFRGRKVGHYIYIYVYTYIYIYIYIYMYIYIYVYIYIHR